MSVVGTVRNRKRVLLVLAYYDYRHHSGVARYAAEAGWRLDDAFTQLRSIPDTWEGDGIISCHSNSEPFVQWLSQSRHPVVDIGEHDDISPFPRVKTDNDKIAQLAVDHFAARGYRSVGFVWRTDNLVKRRRLEAMKRAAHHRQMHFMDLELDQISTLAARLEFPIALLASNDSVAVRALGECEDAGILVPEQTAILGIDNFEYRCVPASVPLSSIDANQEHIGYEAAALLDRLMTGQAPPPGPILVPPAGIVERDSTDMVAIADREVARAMRFISQNCRRPVGLKDIAGVTAISLRRLQTRFKQCLGRTMLQEINGRRVAQARKMLVHTNRRIRAIAVECGFGSAVKMIRIFRQYTGASPKLFRKQSRLPEAEATTTPTPRP